MKKILMVLISIIVLLNLAGCEQKRIDIEYNVCSLEYDCDQSLTQIYFKLPDEHPPVAITLCTSNAGGFLGNMSSALIQMPESFGSYGNTSIDEWVDFASFGVDVAAVLVEPDPEVYQGDDLYQKLASTISGWTPANYVCQFFDSEYNKISEEYIPVGKTTYILSSKVQYIRVYSFTPVPLAGDSYIIGEIGGKVSYENAYEIENIQETTLTSNVENEDLNSNNNDINNSTSANSTAGSVTLTTGNNVVTNSNAVLYATINNPSGLLITDCGITVYKNGNVVKTKTETVNSGFKYAASVPMWYDLNAELGLTLTPGTTYTYDMYSVIGGVKQTSAQGTFTSLADSQTGSVTLRTGNNVVTNSNAVLYSTINNPSGLLITDCGITVYKNGNVVKTKTETVNSGFKYAASVPMWYDLNAELGLTLTPGTTYTYDMYSVIGGVKQTSALGTFTTR